MPRSSLSSLLRALARPATGVSLVAIAAACSGGRETTATPIDIAPSRPGASSEPAPGTATPPPPSAPTSPSECARECRALPSDALAAAIAQRAKQAHRCYDSALVTEPTLRGRVQIRMTIAPDGHVCTATSEAGKTSGSMSAVAECVAGIFRSSSLPPVSGGCTELSLPIAFVPRADDAGAP